MNTLLIEYKPARFAHELFRTWRPPAWLAAGLQQTASGYGGRLNTGYMVHALGRWRRLYCACWSNAGSVYVIARGRKVFFM